MYKINEIFDKDGKNLYFIGEEDMGYELDPEVERLRDMEGDLFHSYSYPLTEDEAKEIYYNYEYCEIDFTMEDVLKLFNNTE